MTDKCKQKEAFVPELFKAVPNSLYKDFFFFLEKKNVLNIAVI